MWARYRSIITVLDTFDLTWNVILGRIQKILNEPQYATLDAKLHLVQGAVVCHTGSSTPLAPNPFNQNMDLGSSMGPESSSGTLGLYLKIGSSLEDTKILALTNYHVVLPKP